MQQLKNIEAAATELQHQLPTLKIRGPKLLGNVTFLPSTFYILPGHIAPSGQEVNVPGKKIPEIQQKIYCISRELAGAPGVETQDGRFNLSRFLAIYGSFGVCGTSVRAARARARVIHRLSTTKVIDNPWEFGSLSLLKYPFVHLV